MYLFYQIQPGLSEQLPEFIFLVDSSSYRESRENGGLTRIGKIETGQAPSLPGSGGLLLGGLLGEGSSDVSIFLHHESSVGRTQVEDQIAGYAIDGHSDPAVRTDGIGAVGWECRRTAAEVDVVRVGYLIPVKSTRAGGLEESDAVLEGRIETIHDERGLTGNRGERSALLLGKSAVLDCGSIVGEEVGAALVQHPEDLWADGAARQSEVDLSAAVRSQGVGAARDREIGVYG